MGAFALAWFVAGFAAPPLARWIGPRRLALGAAVVLTGCRIALTGTDGGQVQLYVASVGLLAGLFWLAATAVYTADPAPGLAFGLALGTVVHTAVDTYDLTWRGGVLGWTLIALSGLAFLAAQWATREPDADGDARGGTAAWFVFGPVFLLWGMIGGSPALAGTAISYAYGDFAGVGDAGPVGDLPVAVLIAVSAAAFVYFALRPHKAAIALLPIGAAAFAYVGPTLFWTALPLTAIGLGAALGIARGAGAGPRRGYGAIGGMAVFGVAAVVYYAAYDLGYPNGWLPIVVAALVGAVAIRWPRRSASVRSWALRAGLATLVVTIAAGAITPVTVTTVDPGGTDGRIRMVAYNIRMGFGLDGRFDLDALVATIAGQRPDVVLLSEVDRAWLLNGGHDTLALLSDRLGLPYTFAPAADPVWGDAVLARLPIVEARTTALSAVGAPTGAQALGVVLTAGPGELTVVSTHLQPPPGDGPVVQAREVARFARQLAGDRPLVIGGDLNTRPGDPAFSALLMDAGVVDGLAAARPLPTSPSNAPAEEIDHLLVSPDIQVTDVAAPPGTASDHRPVAATLSLV
jgi:endonuclease/exonuclease/phosphatase family metal-dependent hydrolase